MMAQNLKKIEFFYLCACVLVVDCQFLQFIDEAGGDGMWRSGEEVERDDCFLSVDLEGGGEEGIVE